ncbi:hypothetical protein [Acinetobacter indicus]|uniref:hypothetical protein n=1 Tax=Acinetobacter indicus TaxID=756892 RepID=UPI001E65B125|nr:hypothetical protein [Acinetobacter indicus]
MDLQKENNLIQESFEVEADEVGFCLDQKWGDYENPYENSDTALAFNFFKKGWQATKAQSDKKIKLLLCDEHLQKCESPTGVFNSQYPDEEPCLICLAKEAKAKAVPNTQALHDRLLVKSIREHVESHISEISVNDLFDKGWLAAMKCIQNNIDMLEAQELAK